MIAKVHRTDLVTCSHSGEKKNPVLELDKYSTHRIQVHLDM